jgi:VWFA-related protein
MVRKSFLQSRIQSRILSRILPFIFLVCSGTPFFALSSAPLFAQAVSQPSAPAVQPQSAGSVNYNPTRPEPQPNLAIDRDPILSPDAQDNILTPPPAPPTVAKTTNQPGTNQQPGSVQRGQNGLYTLSEDVNEVLLPCTVVDEKGRLVMDLRQGNFHVFEDGVPQTIASFEHRDVPVSMGILVDNSGSMIDKRAAATSAALDLVRASNPQDTAFIVNFSDRAYLDQGPTSNINLLERGLSRFDARGMTALYDAVAASADELSHHARQEKQVLLIITDGADNASRLSLQQAIRRVQNLGGPVVYSIGLLFDDDKQEAADARNALQSLSDETGGIAFFPSSLQDVSQIAQEVAQDIRNQYILGYHSTRAASLGGYRTVHVDVSAPGHPKLIVRTRRGYYPRSAAQRQQTAQAAQPATAQPAQPQ